MANPGAYPLEELEAALLRAAVDPPPSLIEQLGSDELGLLRAVKRVLPDDRSELLLVVDQLEEVFTLVEDEARRGHFLSSIERAVRDPRSRVRVVTTLRADFYDRPLAYRDFGELLRGRVETVLPLAPDELERAIMEPAARVGAQLEPGLLARVVTDVVDEPGALPLLQYALTELYEHRNGETLTLDAYSSIHGISGAVAGRAEALYEVLDPEGREAARQLFLRLVTVGEPADTRRRVQQAELDTLAVDQAQLAIVTGAFGAARLLSFDRDPRTQAPTIEVAHEALLGEWARLQGWIVAARENLRAHRRLSAAAAEWLESGRDASTLLRGRQLARFETWGDESGIAQTELERGYLDASVAARSAEKAEEESQQARERGLEQRSVRRLRALVAVLAGAALVAAGLTAFAFDQSSRSREQARIATARQLAAASVANLEVDPELSILLALRAVETSPGGAGNAPPEAIDALHQAIAASRLLATIQSPGTTSVAFSPDGTRLATAGAGADRAAYVWDARTARLLLRLRGSAAPVQSVAYSPDGTRVATGGKDGSTLIWNPATGKRLFALPDPGSAGIVPTIAFSPDGNRLAAADGTGRVLIWDLGARPRLLQTIRGAYALCGLAWSPDGEQVGAGHCGEPGIATARAWDVRTGRVTFATRGQSGAIFGFAFSPDSRYVATGGLDGIVRIWRRSTGRLVRKLSGHTGSVLALAYSPDGMTIASGSTDATARLWDAASGAELLVLHGHSAEVTSVAFAPGGRRLATGSQDGTARIWDVTTEGSRDALTLVTLPLRVVESVVYSPDGTSVTATADGSAPGSTDLLDFSATSGRLLGSTPVPSLSDDPSAYTPDGRMSVYTSMASSADGASSTDGTILAVGQTGANGSSNGVVEVRNAASGDRLIATLRGGHGGVQSIQLDRRDRLVAVGYRDGTAIVWDAASGRRLTTFAAASGPVDTVAFDPTGTLLATAGDDTTVKLWDLSSSRLMLTLRGHTAAVTGLAFSPDGDRLASSSRDGTVRVYVLPVDQLMGIARSRLTHGWTGAECKQYLATSRCPRQP